MQGPVFRPGAVVWIRARRWRVARSRRVDRFWMLDVVNRDDARTFIAPFDRPRVEARRSRPCTLRRQQALARLARLVRDRHTLRSLSSAVGAAVAILPHQLEPALAVLDGARRVLVADEVGLGKTIQAALVIAELCQRRPSARVLVVAPAALRAQWADELQTRFGLAPTIADARQIAASARAIAAGDNPWARAGVRIASLDYLKQRHVLDAIPADAWDLVVIDEAHGVCGESERYRAAACFAGRARHVLLLTATPHTGDGARFARLIELGRLPAIDDRLTVFRRTRRQLGVAATRRIRWHQVRLSAGESAVIDALAGFERAAIAAAGSTLVEHAYLVLSVFRKRALSTMHALRVSLKRRRQWLCPTTPALDWRQPSLAFEATDDVVSDDERASLGMDIGMPADDERSWLERLLQLAHSAGAAESKLERLATLLRRSREPVAIFTEFRDSLEAMRRRLEPAHRVAVLHGGQSDAERQHELRRFLGGDAAVLLATDVAGQGLNLQSRTRWIVSLELPWNPGRIEQRAGRVDRIGQPRTTHATLLVARHDAESKLLAHMLRRTLVARQAIGDDTLLSAAPSDRAIRAHLLAHVPLPAGETSGPAVTICRTFSRVARAEGRALLRRRALTRLPNRQVRPSTRPGIARLGLPLTPGAARNTLAVFSVALTSASGEDIERHLVVLRGPQDCRRDSRFLDDARRIASAALAARQRRLARLLQRVRDRASGREAGLGLALEAQLRPRGAQVGLFDRRELRRMELVAGDLRSVRRRTHLRLRELDIDARVEIGRPVLELILTP